MKPEILCWATDAKAIIDTPRVTCQIHELSLGPLVLRIGVSQDTDCNALFSALVEIASAVSGEQARRDKAAEAAA